CGKVLEINGLPQPDIVVVTNRIVHERGGIGIEGKDPGRPYMGQVTIFGNLIKLGASGSSSARNRLGAGETLPHRRANWTNPATSGHNQRPESLDFLGSPKGSIPSTPARFRAMWLMARKGMKFNASKRSAEARWSPRRRWSMLM